ncbi:MAG: nucleotide sugar dehydrogenase [Muribaculaceae bacterium]|nr:nucleotide sugar dehydrogenase [Muribaculaceae bacterium]
MKTSETPASLPERKDIRLGVIGLGYVGLPLARLFSTKYPTIGFDISKARVDELNAGHDSRLEVTDQQLAQALNENGLKCTSKIEDLRDCNFYVVAVPTPVDDNKLPDLGPLIDASELIGKIIGRGDIVVFESTVYPGVTEEECIPVIERESGLRLNHDFYGGYSPERINPGDRLHTVECIRKVTSGSTPEVAELIDRIYDSVLVNGTFKASSIKVAEASKIIENAQRDVNIAFFNELARIFNALGIDTSDVIEAASSKWNFIKLKPGLVGGHCISVDPYYLIQKAKKHDIVPDLLISARNINESMGAYVTAKTLDLMNLKGIMIKDAKVLLLGITFKENCPDVRNTKVISIYNTLREYTTDITVIDHWADAPLVEKAFGIKLSSEPLENLKGQFDAVILAVAHCQFCNFNVRDLLRDPEKGVVYDVKSILPRDMVDGRL